MSNGTPRFERLEEQPEALSAANRDLVWVEQLQPDGSFLSRKVESQNLSAAGGSVNILYGTSRDISPFSDSAQSASAAAAANFSNRSSKRGRLLTGALVAINAPAANGFYWPYIAFPIHNIGVLRFYSDDWQKDSYWNRGPDQSVDSAPYQLWVRRLPLAAGNSLEVIVKMFD